MNQSSTFVRFILVLAMVLSGLPAVCSMIGPPVQVKDGASYWPAISYNEASDKYLVIWGDYSAYPNGGPQVRGQIIDANSSDLVGRDFAVSSWPSGVTYIQSIEYNPDNGEWLVVFVIEHSGSEGDIYAQRIDAYGNQIGSYIPLVTTAGYQSQAHVAYDSDSGRYLVTWTDWNGALKIHGRLFDQYGSPVSSRISISDSSAYSKFEPRVTYNPVTHQFLVVWSDQRNWNGMGNDNDWVDVYGQLIDGSTGALVGSNIMVCGPTGVPYVGDGLDMGEVIANPTDGRYFLAVTRLHSTGWVTLGRLLNPNGSPYTSLFNISYPGRGGFAGLVYNSVDNTFITSYLDGNYDISAKQFSATGSQVGGIIPVFRSSLYEENFGLLAIRPSDGQCVQVTTWFENLVTHTSPKYVLTQRFDTATDTHPPDGPVMFRAYRQSETSVKLTWTNPGDMDVAGAMVRRGTDRYPTSITDGELVCNRYAIPGSSDSNTHVVAASQTYYYTLFSYDNASPRNYSAGVQAVSSSVWLNETFDNYSLGYLDRQGGWTRSDNRTSGCYVQDVYRAGTSGRAVEILANSGVADSATIADFGAITGGRHKISFDMRRNSGASANQSILEVFGSGARVVRVYWGSGYRILTGPGDTITDLLSSPVSGRWYHVEIEVDLATRTVNAWVDGVQKVFSRPFHQAAAQIDNVILTGYLGGVIPSYLDNLKGERVPIPPEAPVVTAPAIEESVETQYPEIVWTGEPHDKVEVHVNTTNNPSDGSEYDSGEVTSSADHLTAGPLSVDPTYYVFVRLHNEDGWGPWSLPGHSFTVVENSSPPSAPSGFAAMGSDRSMRLSWVNPPQSDFEGVMIRYSPKGYPASTTDGLLAGTVIGVPGRAGSYNHSVLTNGVRYYYSIFAYDSSGSYSGPATDFSSPEIWNLEYLADSIPTSSSPVWTVYDGSELYSHVEPSGGFLHILDDSIASGSKVLWSRNWGASDATGATLLIRAKCAAASPGAYSGNVTMSNGSCSITFVVLPDRVASKAVGSGSYDRQYSLDGSVYHKYRFTLGNMTYACYVDENPVPVFTGIAYTSTDNVVSFGLNGSAETQSLYIDSLFYKVTGASPPTASPSIDIPAAKLLPDGTVVNVCGNVVSGTFADYFYIQDGLCGLRVDKSSHGRSVGQAVDATGTMQTNSDGERYLSASLISTHGTGLAASPVGMSGLALGGADFSYDPLTGAGQMGADGPGPNNIGMLIRTWGRVTGVDPLGSYFWIDDGSGPVKVLSGGLTEPLGQPYVVVTGISTLDGSVSPPARAVRPRTQADIAEY